MDGLETVSTWHDRRNRTLFRQQRLLMANSLEHYLSQQSARHSGKQFTDRRLP